MSVTSDLWRNPRKFRRGDRKRCSCMALASISNKHICVVAVASFALSIGIGSHEVQAWVPNKRNGHRAKLKRASVEKTSFSSSLSLRRNIITAKQQSDGDISSSSSDDERNCDNHEINGSDKQGHQQKPITGNMVAVSDWKATFTPPKKVPAFKWRLPREMDFDPVEQDIGFCDLLMQDAFIDKSAALYQLLKKQRFNPQRCDFIPVSLHMVYPRRFAKTTMLGFMEAVFSPLPKLDGYSAEKIKNKIASFEFGKELLEFGMHPVLWLDLQGVRDIRGLNWYIETQLEQAGLEGFVADQTMSPKDNLKKGVSMLNEKFKAETGVESKTIVLIDEHDKPFRDREKNVTDPLIGSLIDVFSLGKDKKSGISLMILCGLTRMVGTGLSTLLNNLVDVSQMSVYHGLCGIAAREFVKCCSSKLDRFAKKQYDGKTLEQVLETVFAPQWSGFRFGIDNGRGDLNPNKPEGALFSPLDVWEIVQSLTVNLDTPSSQWIETMESEFDFSRFADRYSSTREDLKGLLFNLSGGWLDKTVLKHKLRRDDYLLLNDDVHVQKLLFELGLLSVKRVARGQKVLLGPTNSLITRNAVKMLVDMSSHGETPEDLATQHLSYVGFGEILQEATTTFTNAYCETGTAVPRENALHDFLFLELLFCFPQGGKAVNYELYKELTLDEGRLDMAIEILYRKSQRKAVMIEAKLAKMSKYNPENINRKHMTNLKEAKSQISTYTWQNKKVKTVLRVAVSGVWHPSIATATTYELSTKYEFHPSEGKTSQPD